MTWYAQQLIADATPSLAGELRAHPTFASGLFHVKDLAAHRTIEDEVREVVVSREGSRVIKAPVERGPRLPPAGLLFVRELCDISRDDHAREWFGVDAISWDVPDRDRPHLEIDRVRVVARLGGGDSLPPDSMLREAKQLSAAHGSTITYFSTAFWGGDQELAIAWVFDPTCGEVVYSHAQPDDLRGPGDDVWAWRLDSRGDRMITQGDVLSLALLHHGLQICHRFAPHERGFPWAEHRGA